MCGCESLGALLTITGFWLRSAHSRVVCALHNFHRKSAILTAHRPHHKPRAPRRGYSSVATHTHQNKRVQPAAPRNAEVVRLYGFRVGRAQSSQNGQKSWGTLRSWVYITAGTSVTHECPPSFRRPDPVLGRPNQRPFRSVRYPTPSQGASGPYTDTRLTYSVPDTGGHSAEKWKESVHTHICARSPPCGLAPGSVW